MEFRLLRFLLAQIQSDPEILNFTENVISNYVVPKKTLALFPTFSSHPSTHISSQYM